MGGGEDAHVHPHRTVAAHGLELAVLQHAQEPGLQREGKLGDLVDEERAAVRDHEASRTGTARAGEGALPRARTARAPASAPAPPAQLSETKGCSAREDQRVDGAREPLLAAAAARPG